MRILFSLVLLLQFVTSLSLSGQQLFYQKGVLDLPNEGKMKGELWFVTENDSTTAVYYRKHSTHYPIRYGADEVVSFNLLVQSKRFVSVPLETPSGVRRHFAEMLYDGVYKLLLITFGTENVYYLADNSGNITRLVNTYLMPEAGNNFKIIYNNEYRPDLVRIFSDMPAIESRVQDLEYNRKSLTSLIEEYHEINNLPGIAYPIQKRGFSAVASAGFAGYRSAEGIDGSVEFGTTLAYVGVAGELFSISKPVFGNVGFSLFKGYQQMDLGGQEIFDYIIYTELISRSLLARIDAGVGFRFLRSSRITPFIQAGGEHYLYLAYERENIQELLDNENDIMVTNITTLNEKPGSFSAIRFGPGIDYTINKRSSVRCGASYHYFIKQSSESVMKNGIDFTVSFIFKVK